MALKKELKFDNGVIINYHRIDDVVLDNKNKTTQIAVVSYTDESYRLKEVENKAKKDRYDELILLILKENEKSAEERNTEQIIEWSNEANSLVGKFIENINLEVVRTNYEFKDITDLSMSNLYNILKQEALFVNAEDCL